jgi:hypothetical protein
MRPTFRIAAEQHNPIDRFFWMFRAGVPRSRSINHIRLDALEELNASRLTYEVVAHDPSEGENHGQAVSSFIWDTTIILAKRRRSEYPPYFQGIEQGAL